MSSYQSCRAYRWHSLSYSVTTHQTAETGHEYEEGQRTVELDKSMHSWLAIRLWCQSLGRTNRSGVMPYVERIEEYRTTVQQTPKEASRP